MTRSMDVDYVCTSCGREWTGYSNLRVCVKWKGGCGGKLKRKGNQDTPLQAEVKNGKLSITIGIDTLATAYEKGLETKDGDHFIAVVFPDKLQFAKDTLYAMLQEDDIGSSALTEFLDNMMDEAVNQGSTGIDFPEVKANDKV